MLGQFFASDAVMYADEVSGWREAVDTVTAPLVEHGAIKPSYVDAIKESIAAPGGTYIDLGWGIALAQPARKPAWFPPRCRCCMSASHSYWPMMRSTPSPPCSALAQSIPMRTSK